MADAFKADPGAGRAIEALVGDMLRKVLPDIAQDAKRYCPVLTGDLRNSIGWEMIGDVGGMVYADEEYAAAVERGHVTKSGSHVAAQPFLRPAVYKHRDKL